MNLRRWICYGSLSALVLIQPVFGQSRFAIEIGASPIYGRVDYHNKLTIPGANGGNPVNEHWQQRSQGYALSVTLRYALAARLFVSTGLALNRVYDFEPTIMVDPDTPQTQVIGFGHTQRQYQIPVLVSYQTSASRLSPYFSLGVQISFPYLAIYDSGNRVHYPNQSVQVWPTLRAGLIYRLSRPLSILAQPTFTYIFPVGNISSSTTYQVGLQAQLAYQL